jgi:hypothetical protein
MFNPAYLSRQNLASHRGSRSRCPPRLCESFLLREWFRTGQLTSAILSSKGLVRPPSFLLNSTRFPLPTMFHLYILESTINNSHSNAEAGVVWGHAIQTSGIVL